MTYVPCAFCKYVAPNAELLALHVQNQHDAKSMETRTEAGKRVGKSPLEERLERMERRLEALEFEIARCRKWGDEFR